MSQIDLFFSEHPFFASLLETERKILSGYFELYHCPKGSYLSLVNELQETAWIVIQGKLGEFPLRRKEEAPLPAPRLEERQTERYYLPGDTVHLEALVQETLSEKEIISLEDDTQLISISAFHLGKFAQQHPKIHAALKPLYDDQGALIAGLPLEIWEAAASARPPHAKDFGIQWQNREPILHSYQSWYPAAAGFLGLLSLNLWLYQRDLSPYLYSAIIFTSLLAQLCLLFRRFRLEYTLTPGLLCIARHSLLGLRSRMTSYPIQSLQDCRLRRIPILTGILGTGGLTIQTKSGQTLRLFPIDRVKLWQKQYEERKKKIELLIQRRYKQQTVKDIQKWQRANLKLVQKIAYHTPDEGKLELSKLALTLKSLPLLGLCALTVYYRFSYPLLESYFEYFLAVLFFLWFVQMIQSNARSWYLNETHLICRNSLFRFSVPYQIPLSQITDLRVHRYNGFPFGTLLFQFGETALAIRDLKAPHRILEEIQMLQNDTREGAPFLSGEQLEIYHRLTHSQPPL